LKIARYPNLDIFYISDKNPLLNQMLYPASPFKEGDFLLLVELDTSPEAIRGELYTFSRTDENGVIDCSPIVPEAKP
jgi:hypothetical protein